MIRARSLRAINPAPPCISLRPMCPSGRLATPTPPRLLAGARLAGQRMTGMIDDLLNVSKFEAGELRLVQAPIYLPTLLGDKIESYRSQAEKENKTLSLNAPAEMPTVLADGGLIG